MEPLAQTSPDARVGDITVRDLAATLAALGFVTREASPDPADERLMRPGETAKFASVCMNTLRKWRQEEGLPYLEPQPGTFRFRPSEVEAWMRQRGRRPATAKDGAA